MRGAPLLESDRVLYRAIDEDFAANLMTGDSFVDRAFVSTSEGFENILNPGYVHPEDRWVLEIRVPAGTRALNMVDVVSRMTSHPDYPKALRLARDEKEWVLPRGLRFQVTSRGDVRVPGRHMYDTDEEYHPPERTLRLEVLSS